MGRGGRLLHRVGTYRALGPLPSVPAPVAGRADRAPRNEGLVGLLILRAEDSPSLYVRLLRLPSTARPSTSVCLG